MFDSFRGEIYITYFTAIIYRIDLTTVSFHQAPEP